MINRRYFLLQIVLGLLLNTHLRGQEPKELGFVSNHICQEKALEFTEFIPVIYHSGDTDSLLDIMYHWDLHCGLAEPLLRTYILYQIATNTFSEDFLPDNIFDYLYDYQYVVLSDNPHRFLDYYSWEYEKIHPSFNAFTLELARYINGYEDLSDTERFLINFYSNSFEAAWKTMKSTKMEGTKLGSLYHKVMVGMYDNYYKPTAWLTAGAWMPRGNLALLGNHPQVGAGIGVFRKGFFADLNLAIAFLQSKNEYEISYNHQRRKIRDFTNMNFSVALGGYFSTNRQPFLKMGVSFGYEGIMAVAPNPGAEEPGKVINSFSVGPVLELVIPGSEIFFIGFFTRFNFLWFDNKPGTDLSGKAQWLGIKIGTKIYSPNKVGDYQL